MSAKAALANPSPRRVPTAHLLRSAIKAGGVLDVIGTAIGVAHDSYARIPTGGIYHYEDLAMGEQLLVDVGLVIRNGSMLYPSEKLQHIRGLCEEDACEVLMSMVLSRKPPLWLFGAVRQDAVSPELIPDTDCDSLTEIIPDPARREALLLTLGKRHQADVTAKLGELGEDLVVAECRAQLEGAGREDLAEWVQRVSLVSDQLGYDVVAPTLGGDSRRMEVKTTRRGGGALEVSISRNEAVVGLRDPSWALVICEVDAEERPRIVGWCRGDFLRSLLPTDTDPHGRWTTAAITLRPDCLAPGLPPYELRD